MCGHARATEPSCVQSRMCTPNRIWYEEQTSQRLVDTSELRECVYNSRASHRAVRGLMGQGPQRSGLEGHSVNLKRVLHPRPAGRPLPGSEHRRVRVGQHQAAQQLQHAPRLAAAAALGSQPQPQLHLGQARLRDARGNVVVH